MYKRISQEDKQLIKDYLKDGLSIKEISNRMGLKYHTIVYHIKAFKAGFEKPCDYYRQRVREKYSCDIEKELSAIKLQESIFKLKIIEATTPEILEYKIEEFIQKLDKLGLKSQRVYQGGYKKYIAFIEYFGENKNLDQIIKPEGFSIKQNSSMLEEYLIKKALECTKGIRTDAAILLEISHRALLYKIKEYGIDIPSSYNQSQEKT